MILQRARATHRTARPRPLEAVRLGRQEDAKYVINVKQIAKFVVGLGDKVSPTDIEEGMRVG